MEAYVVNGLDVQPLKNIAQTIADLGFNCVRLVNSLDLIYLNPVRQIFFLVFFKGSPYDLAHFSNLDLAENFKRGVIHFEIENNWYFI